MGYLEFLGQVGPQQSRANPEGEALDRALGRLPGSARGRLATKRAWFEERIPELTNRNMSDSAYFKLVGLTLRGHSEYFRQFDVERGLDWKEAAGLYKESLASERGLREQEAKLPLEIREQERKQAAESLATAEAQEQKRSQALAEKKADPFEIRGTELEEEEKKREQAGLLKGRARSNLESAEIPFETKVYNAMEPDTIYHLYKSWIQNKGNHPIVNRFDQVVVPEIETIRQFMPLQSYGALKGMKRFVELQKAGASEEEAKRAFYEERKIKQKVGPPPEGGMLQEPETPPKPSPEAEAREDLLEALRRPEMRKSESVWFFVLTILGAGVEAAAKIYARSPDMGSGIARMVNDIRRREQEEEQSRVGRLKMRYDLLREMRREQEPSDPYEQRKKYLEMLKMEASVDDPALKKIVTGAGLIGKEIDQLNKQIEDAKFSETPNLDKLIERRDEKVQHWENLHSYYLKWLTQHLPEGEGGE